MLDLFGGTGQLGIEAMSRGASKAVFVDSRREACQLSADKVCGKGCNYLLNSGEHKLRSHGRDSYVNKLLPSVLDTIHVTGFIHGSVNALKTCNEGKEALTQAHPQDNDHTDGKHIGRIDEPKDRSINNTKLHQYRVHIAVGITSEEHREDYITVTCDGGSIEHDNRYASNPSGKLIDQPCKQE